MGPGVVAPTADEQTKGGIERGGAVHEPAMRQDEEIVLGAARQGLQEQSLVLIGSGQAQRMGPCPPCGRARNHQMHVPKGARGGSDAPNHGAKAGVHGIGVGPAPHGEDQEGTTSTDDILPQELCSGRGVRASAHPPPV